MKYLALVLAVVIGLITISFQPKSPVDTFFGPTVKVQLENGNGSGTVIASKFDHGQYKTYVLTNAHVVNGQKSIKVLSSVYIGNHVVTVYTNTAEVYKINVNEDLALLVLTGKGDRFPHVATLGEDPDIFDTVYAVGYPYGSVALTKGIVTGYLEEDKVSFVRVSAQVSHGNSGGALFNESGRLVGVPTWVTSISTMVGAVPINYLAHSTPVSRVKRFLSGTPAED